jgi:hypothetical protein
MQRALLIQLLIAVFGTGMVRSQPASTVAPSNSEKGYGAVSSEASNSTYIFGWGDRPAQSAVPRGGSSEGAPVTLAAARSLPLPEIAAAKDNFARDRAAILALAGDFRVSFHEIELVGLTSEYQPPRSYHSWATEHVRVVEDTGRLIRLQHTLVMFFKKPDGTISAPALTKHWRQDWTYEHTDLHEWRGNDVWERRRLTSTEAAGTWTHSVFNLEDSPRYETPGRWEHRGNLSMWTSERAWRPLPRREYTVRSDYDVLEGVHTVALTPTGWVEERNMWKRATAGGTAIEPPRYLAQEIGIDRYERISAPSLSLADDYYKKNGAYWAIVRRVWTDEISKRERFSMRDEVDGKSSYQHHNDYLKKFESGASFDAADAERHVRTTLSAFLMTPSAAGR